MRSPEPSRVRFPRPRSVPAFILCGGLGTRLRKVEARPKAIVPVAGLPFLSYPLRLLWLQGFRQVHLLLGQGAGEIRALLGGPGLEFSEEREPLGTGGALGLVRERAARVNLILNGDSYAEALYTDLLEEHARRGPEAGEGVVLLALRMEDVSEYGALNLDSDGRVTAFLEKGLSGPGWINAGVYAAGQSFLRKLPDGPHSLERDVLPALAAAGRLWAVKQRFFFRDIGTPERLAAAQKEFLWIRNRMGPGERVPWFTPAESGTDRDPSGTGREGEA